MYRIINSLASAEYNKKLGAVVVNFNGYGEPSLYHETMDIAMNIAVIYDTNKWLFVKDFFQDINPHEFLFFVKKWSNTCTTLLDSMKSKTECQVALLTTPASQRKLLTDNEWLKEPESKFNDLKLKIFTTQEEASSFLNPHKSRKLAAVKE